MTKLTPELDAIMQERYGHDHIIALATAEDEIPHVRSVNSFYEDGTYYVLTHALSNKMHQIGKNPAVAIAGDWFTAHGTGVNLGYFGKADNKTIADKMRTYFASWIDNGHNDFSSENTIILAIELTDGVLNANGTRYRIDFTE